MKKQLPLLFWFMIVGWSVIISQPDAATIRQLTRSHLPASIDNFRELLALSNDAHQTATLEPNIRWLEYQLSELGFTTSRLPTQGLDLLLAEKAVDHATETVLVYLQLDGQPVDPNHWDQENPYVAVLKEEQNGDWKDIPWDRIEDNIEPDWRIFARSASDAKGPIAAFLTAYRILNQENWQHDYNLKIIIDSEEELGSPHLPEAVQHFRDRLAADMLIIFDGPRHLSNLPTLTFGARGIATLRITTYGPRVPQHSGHYGNYAPNPALHLAQLLASMKDDRGRVTIPGFYDGVVLDETTRRILDSVPDDEEGIQRSLGIASPDGVAGSYQEAIQYPSLNIRGMSSAWIGSKVRTIVPSAAVADLDIRTVKETDPQRLLDLIIGHIRSQGFHLCQAEPTEAERRQYPRLASVFGQISYGAYRTPFDAKVGRWLDRALNRTFTASPIKLRTSGGSIPIAPFVETLGIPAVTVPTVNRDNNQHSPNENIRLGNYEEAIYTFLGILTEPLADIK